MSHCLIYYPGLLGPEVPLSELPDNEWPGQDKLPQLSLLFNKAHIETLAPASVEQRLLNSLGILFSMDKDVPVAKIRSTFSAQTIPENKKLYCLDPVYIQIDQEEAVLVANQTLELTRSEAEYIIEDLNKHFIEDDFTIHYHSPHEWLVSTNLDLSTVELSTALQSNIDKHQPTGRHQSKWQQFINEIQMLLHTHPVNQQREIRGETTVNSLWLWGGGDDFEYEAIINQVYSDHDMVVEYARFCDISHSEHPEDFKQHLEQAKQISSLLYIFLNQLDAIKGKDVFKWFDYLAVLDNKVLAPIIEQLKNNKLESLTVISDNLSLNLTPKNTRKSGWAFWKKDKSFRQHILRWRKSDNE